MLHNAINRVPFPLRSEAIISCRKFQFDSVHKKQFGHLRITHASRAFETPLKPDVDIASQIRHTFLHEGAPSGSSERLHELPEKRLDI